MSDISMRILLSAAGGGAVTSAIGDITKSLGSSGLGGALLGIGLAAGAAAIGIGVTAVKAAGDFQQQLTTLSTGAGESASNLKMVGDGILNLATQTGTSTKQLTDGMYMIESAGYHGAAGLAVLKAASEGAKVGNADLGVVADATTTIMTDFGIKSSNASVAVNTMIATVANGKTTMSALAGSLSQIMPTASAAGISLTDTSAAMATMTGEGVPAANAATYLRQTILGLVAPSAGTVTALKSVGLSSSSVASEMKKSLPDALQMITDAVGKKFPVGSAAYVNAIKDISGGSKTMQGMLDLTGQHMNTFKSNVDNISSAVKQGGSSITGWAQVQQDFNFKMGQLNQVLQTSLIRIGQQLLPIVTQMADGFLHLVSVGGQVVGFFQHNTAAMDALKIGVMAFVGIALVSLVVGFYTWATAAGAAAVTTLAATWPILAIGAAIGIVVAGFILAYNHITPFRNAVNSVAQFISSNFMPVMRAIGAFLVSTFAPVWQQLVSIFNSQIRPAFAQLMTALQPLMPYLQMLGAIIGGVIVVVLILLVSTLAGVVKGFAMMLPGIATVIAGIINIVTGFVRIVIGSFQVFFGIIQGLATGNWSMFRAGVQNLVNGVVGLFRGLWQVVSGIFQAGIGLVVGFVSGWVSTVIGFFSHLYNTLVGHSIIPDMVNAIVAWIAQLPGRVGAWLQSLVSGAISLFSSFASRAGSLAGNLVNSVVNWFGQLPGKVGSALQSMIGTATGILNGFVSTVFSIGANIVNGIASGITSAIGSVTSAISSVTSAIGKFLPHSPAEQGELAHLNEYGPNLVHGFSNGILGSLPVMRNAMDALTQPVGSALSSGVSSLPSGGISGSGSGSSAGLGSAMSGQTTQNINLTLNISAGTVDESEMDKIARYTITLFGDQIRQQFGNV
jgi:TP901 family phage tail tape measure protein